MPLSYHLVRIDPDGVPGVEHLVKAARWSKEINKLCENGANDLAR